MHFSIKFSHISLIVWLTVWLRGSIHTIHPVVMMLFPHCKIFFSFFPCELGVDLPLWTWRRHRQQQSIIKAGRELRFTWSRRWPRYLLDLLPSHSAPALQSNMLHPRWILGFWIMGILSLCGELWNWLMLPLLMFDLKQPMYRYRYFFPSEYSETKWAN